MHIILVWYTDHDTNESTNQYNSTFSSIYHHAITLLKIRYLPADKTIKTENDTHHTGVRIVTSIKLKMLFTMCRPYSGFVSIMNSLGQKYHHTFTYYTSLIIAAGDRNLILLSKDMYVYCCLL